MLLAARDSVVDAVGGFMPASVSPTGVVSSLMVDISDRQYDSDETAQNTLEHAEAEGL